MNISVDTIADAIYRVEGSATAKVPYGILSIPHCRNPRLVCINTIIHAERDYRCTKIDRAFIYFLADRYCPPSIDKLGNQRWKNNMVRILHI